MRYFLSSLILTLFISCISYPKKEGFTKSDSAPIGISNPYFADNRKDYVYKANIEAFGNAFGGIFVVKKLGENHHRIAFTTELGNKIFDFTFLENDFKVNHILKEMDKKILINILKKDFAVLIKEEPIFGNVFEVDSNLLYETRLNKKKYYYSLSEELPRKVFQTSKGKVKVEFTFSEISNNIAKQIQILHKNIDLKIMLTAI